MDRPLYPFTAVVGQERAKQALLCLAVEPRIGGVLLCGEKGTAKSTLVRALGGLDGVRLLELPVSATEDMLLGGVELEAAVRTGCRTFQPGLLARADGAVLYADEVNLLPSALTAALLDTLETGVCRVERDGISHTCPARFALVGTMNPEEGTLRPQLLDRFGLYVAVTGEREPEARKEVVRRRLAFEENPAAFRAQWARREERLAGQLAAAPCCPRWTWGRRRSRPPACWPGRPTPPGTGRSWPSCTPPAPWPPWPGALTSTWRISTRRRSWPCPTAGGREAKARPRDRREGRSPLGDLERTDRPGAGMDRRTSPTPPTGRRRRGFRPPRHPRSRGRPESGWSRGRTSTR